jgi:hypothetical protein
MMLTIWFHLTDLEINSLMLGFLKIKRSLSLSSSQSISEPIMLNKALESIRTLTPSCSTVSSNAPALSTYSRWYANPEQPLLRTPTRTSLASGCSSSSRKCDTADCDSEMAALRGRSLLFLWGFVVADVVAGDDVFAAEDF